MRGENGWERVRDVFLVFLRLGLTSFGGPIAHLGYFREEFVVRRGWLDEREYADLVALCQFLPGPASSQVGMALGYLRAGYGGALAAWLGFTLPSAVAMILFALGLTHYAQAVPAGVLHGLKVAAVAVVAQAVWGMARTLCPDARRVTLMTVAACCVALAPLAWVQVAVIARRPHGYFITHVEGAQYPVINGRAIDAQAHPLKDHDVIELAGIKMEFFLKG